MVTEESGLLLKDIGQFLSISFFFEMKGLCTEDCLLFSAILDLLQVYLKLGLVWFGYDYRAMIRGPFLRLFNDTPQSMSTSIGLTSGVGTSLKNLTYSCKYSAGETLKVWFARDVKEMHQITNLLNGADTSSYSISILVWFWLKPNSYPPQHTPSHPHSIHTNGQ